MLSNNKLFFEKLTLIAR